MAKKPLTVDRMRSRDKKLAFAYLEEALAPRAWESFKHYYEMRDYVEVANKMGIEKVTVIRYVKTARRKLEDWWEIRQIEKGWEKRRGLGQ